MINRNVKIVMPIVTSATTMEKTMEMEERSLAVNAKHVSIMESQLLLMKKESAVNAITDVISATTMEKMMEMEANTTEVNAKHVLIMESQHIKI